MDERRAGVMKKLIVNQYQDLQLLPILQYSPTATFRKPEDFQMFSEEVFVLLSSVIFPDWKYLIKLFFPRMVFFNYGQLSRLSLGTSQ